MIPSDIPIILDVKRGDIESTAQVKVKSIAVLVVYSYSNRPNASMKAYAEAAYSVLGADSVTLSPYMGWDSIHPFVTGQHIGRGAFVLCKTSNASAGVRMPLFVFLHCLMLVVSMQELQLQQTFQGSPFFEKVLEACSSWQRLAGDHSLVGVVAGATDLDALRSIRSKAPNIWILCPGVGAQGGEAEHVCAAGLRRDGSGLLVSVSRGISRASSMAAAARQLRDDINLLRERHVQKTVVLSSTDASLLPFQRDFIRFALQQDALQFGSFTLKSGRISPYFFNAGKLCSGQSIAMLGRCYAQAVRASGITFDVIFGPAYKGIPLATAFAMAWFQLYGESKDATYNRKEAKDHGEGGLLVGAPISGRRVLIIDDVITAGTAIREAVTFLTEAGAEIVGTVVSLDRQERAGEEPISAIQQVEKEYGFPVQAIVRLRDLVSFVVEAGDQAGLIEHLDAMQTYRSTYGVMYEPSEIICSRV